MCVGLHRKYQLFWSHFSATLDFLDRFSRNRNATNFMKIHPVSDKMFHADDERTDGHDKA